MNRNSYRVSNGIPLESEASPVEATANPDVFITERGYPVIQTYYKSSVRDIAALHNQFGIEESPILFISRPFSTELDYQKKQIECHIMIWNQLSGLGLYCRIFM
jgi:hypothetical protein